MEQRGCGEDRILPLPLLEPPGDQQVPTCSYLRMVLLPTNMTTWGPTVNIWRTHSILTIEPMVWVELIQNKIMAFIIILFLSGLVWPLGNGTYCVAQAVLQLTIAQAALKFAGILFLQSSSPVIKPCFKNSVLSNNVLVIWLVQHFTCHPLVNIE